MANQSRRRIAQDHAALRADLPPDFFFVGDPSDDLRGLTVYLVGPTTTPFESGVFTITLRIPDTYPQEPPKANFHTRIFHPNVNDRTGDVCVETLKRDWTPKVTLKDVLSTIRCLLVYPNPDSSLNEEAGRMLQEGYEVFARHAKMMTEVYASAPEHFKAYVEETRCRKAPDEDGDSAPSDKKLVASSSSSNAAMKPCTPASARRKTQPEKATWTVTRKIKHPVSPATRASTGADSDSDSGKENVVARIRPVSPIGTKRPRDGDTTVAADENTKGATAKDTGEASGRKSPKLKEEPTPSATSTRKEVLRTPKPRIIVSNSNTPATAARSTKKSGVKLGLKRF